MKLKSTLNIKTTTTREREKMNKLTNNSLNLSDDELINTFNNMIDSPPPIASSTTNENSTAAAATTTTTTADNIIICPNAINNNNTSLSATSTTPPQSILKQTDYKIKINNKQNTKSFLPYSSPILNFKNSPRYTNNGKSNSRSNNSINGDSSSFNGTMATKKEKITLIIDDTPFFVTSDLFSSYPNTYLGQ